MAHDFDRTISDPRESFRINVAKTASGPEWVHLNIRPFDNLWPNTCLLISNEAAIALAQALLDATADAMTVAGWETLDTTAT